MPKAMHQALSVAHWNEVARRMLNVLLQTDHAYWSLRNGESTSAFLIGPIRSLHKARLAAFQEMAKEHGRDAALDAFAGDEWPDSFVGQFRIF